MAGGKRFYTSGSWSVHDCSGANCSCLHVTSRVEDEPQNACSRNPTFPCLFGFQGSLSRAPALCVSCTAGSYAGQRSLADIKHVVFVGSMTAAKIRVVRLRFYRVWVVALPLPGFSSSALNLLYLALSIKGPSFPACHNQIALYSEERLIKTARGENLRPKSEGWLLRVPGVLGFLSQH